MARINVVDGTFGRSGAGGVFGRIFLEVGETRFPDEQWSDFAVILLGWWCRALPQCLSGISASIDVPFMEGPFLVQLHRVSPASLHLELVEDGLKRRSLLRVEVEARPLVDSVLVASEQVLAQCRENGWWSADADELADASAILRRSLLRSVD